MVKQQPTKSSNFLERQLLLALTPKLVETAGDRWSAGVHSSIIVGEVQTQLFKGSSHQKQSEKLRLKSKQKPAQVAINQSDLGTDTRDLTRKTLIVMHKSQLLSIWARQILISYETFGRQLDTMWVYNYC